MTPGRRYPHKEFNKALGEVERQAKFTADYPLEVRSDGAGKHIHLVERELWAVIHTPGITTADCDNVAYDWEEVQPSTGGCWTVVDGGRSGSFAYEINANAVSADMVVRLYPSTVDEEFVFEGCSGGGTVV